MVQVFFRPETVTKKKMPKLVPHHFWPGPIFRDKTITFKSKYS